MFEIFVEAQFSAAHHLVNYPGNCAKWHGHNWAVTVFLQASELDELGISVDFRDIKDELRQVLGELDHTDLNAHPEFADTNPTSEVIARYLFKRLGERLNRDTVRVSKVQISETPNTGASYSE